MSISKINVPVPMSLAIEMLDDYIDADIPVMIWGAPGVGKTQIAKQAADKRGWQCIDFRAYTHEPVDCRGLPFPDPKTRTTVWFKPSDLPLVGGNDEFEDEGIFLIDEMNQTRGAMQALLLQILLERKVGEHVFKPGWRIVATGNRATDRANVQSLGTANDNRCAHIEVQVELGPWAAHVREVVKPLSKDMQFDAEMLIAYLSFKQKMGTSFLHVMPEAGQHTFPTPRNWLDKVLLKGLMRKPRERRAQLIGGLVGDYIADDFQSFMLTYSEIPKIAEIAADPINCKLVGADLPGARWGVVEMMGRSANVKTIGACFKYAARLGGEYEVMLGLALKRHQPKLEETAEFGEFAVKYHNELNLEDDEEDKRERSSKRAA